MHASEKAAASEGGEVVRAPAIMLMYVALCVWAPCLLCSTAAATHLHTDD